MEIQLFLLFQVVLLFTCSVGYLMLSYLENGFNQFSEDVLNVVGVDIMVIIFAIIPLTYFYNSL